MKSGEQIIADARSMLLSSDKSPFFGIVATKMQIKEFPEKDENNTFATDGTFLYYDDKFLRKLNRDELQFVIAHEAMHNCLLHTFRLEGRDMELFNVAADYSINWILQQSGFTLTKDCLVDSKYADMSAEQIYSILLKSNSKKKLPTKCSTGSMMPPPKPEPKQEQGEGELQEQEGGAAGQQTQVRVIMTEIDWQITAQQAVAVAQKCGKMPGDVRSQIKATTQSQTDWKEVLRRFVEQMQVSDYTWLKPNKSFLSHGIIMPGVEKENCPKILAAVDTSGSITDEMLELPAREFTEILKTAKPERIDVWYCDTEIRKEQVFTPEDDEEVVLKTVGRGGTAFKPILDKLAAMDEKPALLVWFTDLESYDLRELKDPGIPVLWVVPEQYSHHLSQTPFGESVILPYRRR